MSSIGKLNLKKSLLKGYKMNNTTSRFLCLFSLFVLSINVQAALIYQIDNRYTNQTHPSIVPYGMVTPDSPFADFYDNRFLEAGAFQSSALTSSTMTGTGSSSGTQDSFLASAFGSSIFDITFTVDELTNYSLNGYLDTDFDVGILSVSLFENGVNIFAYEVWDTSIIGINPYSHSGQFVTGNTYQLVAVSDLSDLANGYTEEWQFDLQTTSAVPVPGAVWLFVSGLSGFVAISRRNRVKRI